MDNTNNSVDKLRRPYHLLFYFFFIRDKHGGIDNLKNISVKYWKKILLIFVLMALSCRSSLIGYGCADSSLEWFGTYLNYRVQDLNGEIMMEDEFVSFSDMNLKMEVLFVPQESLHTVSIKLILFENIESEYLYSFEKKYLFNISSNIVYYVNGTQIGVWSLLLNNIQNININQIVVICEYLNSQITGNTIEEDFRLIEFRKYDTLLVRYQPCEGTSSTLDYELKTGVLIEGGNILDIDFFREEFGIIPSGLYTLQLDSFDFQIPFEFQEDNINQNDQNGSSEYLPIVLLFVFIGFVSLLYIAISKRR